MRGRRATAPSLGSDEELRGLPTLPVFRPQPVLGKVPALLTLVLLSLSLTGCGIGGALFRGIFLRSGAPSGEEIRRMEAREEAMLRDLTDRKILVLPVGVLNVDASYREATAQDLASMLRDAGFQGATAGSRVYTLPFPRQPNQAWIYWKRFRALADSGKHPTP